MASPAPGTSRDLVSLLRIIKAFPIVVSLKGCDSAVYQHALTTHFAQNPTTWKRNGKYFPHPLTFPLKFEPFAERLLQPSTASISELPKFAFVHLFFISAASAEEYRTSIRHNVSEWFATLTSPSTPEPPWLIVIDSTRAKEKRNRASLLERIKADYSKHTHRLIEVSESVEHGSFSSLVSALQLALLSHLDALVETWEGALRATWERVRDTDFDLVSAVNNELDYARLFWSIGALEHALLRCDRIDENLYNLVDNAKYNGSLVAWARRVARQDLAVCQPLTQVMRVNSVTTEHNSIAGIRHVLLAQKLLLTLQIYNKQKCASLERQPSPTPAPVLVGELASAILKYACNTLHAVLGNVATLEASISPSRLWVWCAQLSADSFTCAALLSDVHQLEECRDVTAAMYRARFEAWLKLAEVAGDEEKKAELLRWLEPQIQTGDEGDEDVLRVLSASLLSHTRMAVELQRVHDMASAFLIQSGMMRTAGGIGYAFAKQLSRWGSESAALPYLLRFVAGLMAEGDVSEMALAAAREAAARLLLEEDYHRKILIRLYLALQERTLENRRVASEKLIRELRAVAEGNSIPSIRLTDFRHYSECPFRVCIMRSPNQSSTPLIPGTQCSMSARVDSGLAVPIANARITVVMRLLDSRVPAASDQRLAFYTEYDPRDQTARVLSVRRNKEKKKESSGTGSEESLEGREGEGTLRFETSQGGVMLRESGVRTDIMLTATASSTGVFSLDSVEVSLEENALQVILPYEMVTSQEKPLLRIVGSRKPRLSLREGQKPKSLLSGVAQTLSILVEAGSAAIEKSEFRVRGTGEGRGENGEVDFLSEDGLWETLVVYRLERMEINEKRLLDIQCCLPLSAHALDETAIKICFDWMGDSFVFPVTFKPLLVGHWTTSYLENKPLVELTLEHPLAKKWSVVPSEATLVVTGADDRDATAPRLLGQLLNPDLQPLNHGGIYTLVWQLSPSAASRSTSSRSLPRRFSVRIAYSIRRASRDTKDEIEAHKAALEREYTYSMEGELMLNKVEYEICSQVLSQQPGAQLCRVGTACHLIVSLRALEVDSGNTLIVAVAADETIWSCMERSKPFALKESGLGQVSFVIIPLIAGSLPYPTVTIHPAGSSLGVEDRFWSDVSELGKSVRLCAFERTAGRQIRVLGASQSEGSISSSRGSDSLGKKATIKQKLQKLFD